MENNKQNKKMNHEEQNKIQICNASIVFLWKKDNRQNIPTSRTRSQKHNKKKSQKIIEQQPLKQHYTKNTRIAGKCLFIGRETSYNKHNPTN